MNIDKIMSDLAQYARMSEEIAATVEDLKNQLKSYMIENEIEVLNGSEHKATYKTVTASRVDTTTFKKDYPEIAAQYTKLTTSKRFTFD